MVDMADAGPDISINSGGFLTFFIPKSLVCHHFRYGKNHPFAVPHLPRLLTHRNIIAFIIILIISHHHVYSRKYDIVNYTHYIHVHATPFIELYSIITRPGAVCCPERSNGV